MKLCKNCKYYYIDHIDIECRHYCLHPISIYHTNLINGLSSYNSCMRMRDNLGCGISAKLYEERPSLLARMMFWKKSTHKSD